MMAEVSAKEVDLPDHLTEEISRLKPRFRSELTVTFDDTNEDLTVVVEDPASGSFFRLGYAEYAFASMLHGSHTIAEVVSQSTSALDHHALDETQAASLAKWLIDNNLATTVASSSTSRIQKLQQRKRKRSFLNRLNPISTQIILGNPASLIDRVAGGLSWLFSSFGVVVWSVALVFGATQLVGESHRIQSSLLPIMASSNLWAICVTWVFLRLAHECGHAVAARRWGANVHEAGITFILFFPLPFVNLTSSWKLPSKWQRIAVAAAGMYVEVFLAAIAAVVWSNSSDVLVRQYAMNVVIAAGLTTIVFNLNPLMKFDGYYILSDVLNLPNLATHAQQWQQQAIDRLLLGTKVAATTPSLGHRLIVAVYSVAASIWRIGICVSLSAGASVLFAGAGLAIAGIAVCFWVSFPAIAIAKRTVRHCCDYRLGWIRPTVVICTASLLVGFVWNLQWQPGFTSPVVVGHDPMLTVRTKADGFVDSILVETGTVVSIGTPILTLTNPDLVLKLQEVGLAAEQSRLRQRSFASTGMIAAAQSEEQTSASLIKQSDELKQQLQSLVVVAESDGVVLGADLKELEGQYLSAGSEICQIAGSAVLYGYMSQRTADAFEQFVDQHSVGLVARFPGLRNPILCNTASVNPTATQNIEHPAVTSLCDNQIPVQQIGPSSDNGWQLVEPHVQVKLNFQTDSMALQSGRTGVLHFDGAKETIGNLIVKKLHLELTNLQQWRRRLIGGR